MLPLSGARPPRTATRDETGHMAEPHWEHFPHDADVGVRGIGTTCAQAFEQAAIAMTGAITDPETVEPELEIAVACEAPDNELLLVDWLNALVYEMATRHMLFSKFDVSIRGDRLAATARGAGRGRYFMPAVPALGVVVVGGLVSSWPAARATGVEKAPS